MGRKRSRARVSPDSDSDGGEEGAAAPAASGSKSLYEVRRPQTLARITAERAGPEVACGVSKGLRALNRVCGFRAEGWGLGMTYALLLCVSIMGGLDI